MQAWVAHHACESESWASGNKHTSGLLHDGRDQWRGRLAMLMLGLVSCFGATLGKACIGLHARDARRASRLVFGVESMGLAGHIARHEDWDIRGRLHLRQGVGMPTYGHLGGACLSLIAWAVSHASRMLNLLYRAPACYREVGAWDQTVSTQTRIVGTHTRHLGVFRSS